MSASISIVIPSLADRELLELALVPLLAELDRRDAGDEVLVVDDSGAGALETWLVGAFPRVRYLANPENLGFARTLLAGVRAARHELVFAMNPDLRVRAGIFDALAETLRDDVHAVAPYVLLDGQHAAGESLAELVIEDGFPAVRHQDLDVRPGEAHPEFPDGIPVAFALGGAMLVRRRDFLARPFDPLFEPFYWEDVDAAQDALRAGRRVLVDPRAVAEHHHRGTISSRVPERLVRAAIEKNRLLFAWKHMRTPEACEAHFAALTSRVMEHAVCEERDELIWLLLALEQLDELPLA